MALSTSALGHRYIWGLKGDVRQNVAFHDEHTIVYVAGHTVVLYNTNEKRQRFIPGTSGGDASGQSEGITALALCPSKRFIAVAEKAERAFIVVYDLRTLRKRKNLAHAEEQAREYISMAFSTDNETLLSLSGAPTWNLTTWRWAKGKVSAVVTANLANLERPTLFECSLSPLDSSVAVALSTTTLAFYRVMDTEMRAMPQPQVSLAEGSELSCHCWLRQPEDHCVAGTSQGELILYRSGDFVCFLACALPAGVGVSSLAALSQGFVAGSANGQFHLLMQEAEAGQVDELFALAHVWSFDGAGAGHPGAGAVAAGAAGAASPR